MLHNKNRWSVRTGLSRIISKTQGRAYTYHADLLWRLQNGDQSAWAYFVTEWGARIYSYLRYNTHSEEDAQALLSKILFAVVREMPKFKGEITLATFVYKLVYYEISEYWQRHGQPDWATQAQRLEHQIAWETSLDAKADIHTILHQLEQPAQQTVLLRYQAGLTIHEIAEVLDRSVESIESLFRQIYRQFQTLLFKGTGA